MFKNSINRIGRTTCLKYLLINLLFFLQIKMIISQSTEKVTYTFEIPKQTIEKLIDSVKSKLKNTQTNEIPLTLYMPDGQPIEYHFNQNNTVDTELQLNYPEILTFSGYSTKHKDHYVSMTLYNNIVSAFILNGQENSIAIHQNGSEKYISFYSSSHNTFNCLSDERTSRAFIPSGLRTSTNGATLRNYRFAIVITDEFEAANGNGASAIAAAVTLVNNMNTIYKRDLAVTFTAIVRPETSAFDIVPNGPNPDYGGTCVSAYFSSAEYDLGMLFHNPGGGGGGGVAYLGVVCNNTGSPIFKSRSWAQANPNNDYGFLSIVVHEAAHMFNATHSFNSDHSNCGSQRSNTNAYEPGGGISIMAYPGVCGAQSITDNTGSVYYNSIPYFHLRNLEQMVAFINGSGNSCASSSASGNTPPTAIANPCSAPSVVTIPASTPFELTGSYSDNNIDNISYSWEQYDSGPPNGAPNAACGSTSGPIFRNYIPTSNPTRYFPSLPYILNNGNTPPFTTIGECLPTASRTLNFKLIVRDNNNNGGGIDISAVQLNVSTATGPLAVSSPNTNVTWIAGNAQTVTWTGSNTSSICATVNIRLSLDGGYTFPYLLLSNVANNGSQSLTLPSNVPASSSARIKVESSCYDCVRFFDISNVNFTISSSCQAAGSNICPITALNLPYGSASLNMGLTQAFGNELNSKSLTTAGPTVNVGYNLTPAAPGTGNCTPANFGYGQTSFRFKISAAGNYTFTLSSALPLTVYNGTYTSSSPCTNYIGSTAYDLDGVPFGSAGFTNQMDLNLTNACGEYTAVLFASAGTSATLTITGPSGVIIYEHSPPAASGYSYIYTAVNTANNQIAAVSTGSDFTTLGGGSYCIYGMHYLSSLTPSNWIGLTISQLIAAGNCMLASNNCKPVTITCSSVVTSGANSGPGTLRDISACIGDNGTITFSSGINPTLTTPLLLSKNMILNGNTDVQNNPLTTINLNFSGTYGIKIDPGKSVTFKDLKVNMLGSASPVILNEGSLTLNNAEIKGNVNPVVNNQNSGTIQISNIVVIKKQ